ncbi:MULTISPECIES: AraC family transcriptional regulator [Streptomyces]|uniref:AraC family transcriptional regulator n=1 Tax=Streptomyces TaxID=1883 RepID=UPI00163CFC23|nr:MULTISPECIES: AraC family transcriptional regulator [Streptomyces]MBC2877330.1 AraC family transcriptional regulator [Streptomyces sp. TYQ1024]UBI38137.1 AraC family transcriptional regulator [Streptomyces mobaraensis]UKW30723.1 AraC family transcriptional regulator [Streptomyces sp. TYQ1024]
MPQPTSRIPPLTADEPTIGAHFVRAALAGAVRLGHDPVPLLQTARIPPLLPGDDRARVTPEQFTRLVRAVRRTTRDEFLALGTAPSRPGTFAMMCHACVGCPDLGTAVDRAARFYGLFPGGPALALELGAEETVFALRNDLHRLPEGRFLAECALVVWHRLASWLIGRRIALSWAEFAYPAPPYAAEYGRMFGCPVRFGARRTGVGLARHWLSAPLLRDEAGLTDLLRRAPADLLLRRDYGTTVTEQVRRALAGALREDRRPVRLPEATETAARLAVSPATLRRRLAAEGTSYRRVKDQVRRDAALASLAAGREPTTELAARLGFSEPTAFHRAFHRWTGTTPGAYRRTLPPT